MKTLLNILALLGLASSAYASPYFITPILSTATGTAWQSISGRSYVAASSVTFSTPTITLDGTLGKVTAVKFAGDGSLLTNVTVIPVTYLNAIAEIAVSTTVLQISKASTGTCILPNVLISLASGAVTCATPSNITGSAASVAIGGVDFSTITTRFNATAVATSTLRIDIGVVGESTNALSASTSALQGELNAVNISTTSLYLVKGSTGVCPSGYVIESVWPSSVGCVLSGSASTVYTVEPLTGDGSAGTPVALNSTWLQELAVSTTAVSASTAALDTAKVNRTGDTVGGPLVINSYISPENIQMQTDGKLIFNGPGIISTSPVSVNIFIGDGPTPFPSWEDKDLIPNGAWMAPVAHGNGKIYIIGSFEGNVYNRIHDIAGGGAWSSGADYPSPLQNASAVFYDGKVYVFGGDGLSSVWAYDPLLDSWSSKASMSYPRTQTAACLVNGKIYVIGGTPGEGFADSLVEEYDPALDSWTIKAAMPTPRFTLQCGVVNSKIYVVGGTEGGTQYDINEEYDPALDSWTTKTSMPIGSQDLAACAVNGKVYAIDGSTWATQVYDPLLDSWSIGYQTPIQMQQLRGCATVGNAIYVPNGYTDGKLWKFNTDYLPGTYQGNVGIGTDTPATTLDVKGSLTVSSATFVGVSISTQGAGAAGDAITVLCRVDGTFALGGGCECGSFVAETSRVNRFNNVNAGEIPTGWTCQSVGATGGQCSAYVICSRLQ